MVADRGGFTGLTMPNVTPFFEFVLAVCRHRLFADRTCHTALER